MSPVSPSRRAVLRAGTAALPAALLGGRVMAGTEPKSDGFAFEVMRTDAEWKERLTENEYKIMRQGGTEAPKSHPMWDSDAPGRYSCKGCDLQVYDARWKEVLDLGWLFYRHCEPNAVLTSIDLSLYSRFFGPSAETAEALVPETDPYEELTPAQQAVIDDFVAIEIHCRRCGSHFGHIIWANKTLLHCVNGTSLRFEPEST